MARHHSNSRNYSTGKSSATQVTQVPREHGVAARTGRVACNAPIKPSAREDSSRQLHSILGAGDQDTGRRVWGDSVATSHVGAASRGKSIDHELPG